MSDYEKLYDRLEALEPWAEFLIKYEGSEVGSYAKALLGAIECAASATYYDHALKMVECLDEIVKDAVIESEKGGWVYDMIEQAQFDWEREMEKYKDEHRPNVKSPMQELEELREKS